MLFGSIYTMMRFVIFYFSIHKLNFNLKNCRVVEDIIIYI
jgi:hypothetical protein